MIEYDVCVQYYYANWGVMLLFAATIFLLIGVSFQIDSRMRSMQRFILNKEMMQEYYDWKDQRER